MSATAIDNVPGIEPIARPFLKTLYTKGGPLRPLRYLGLERVGFHQQFYDLLLSSKQAIISANVPESGIDKASTPKGKELKGGKKSKASKKSKAGKKSKASKKVKAGKKGKRPAQDVGSSVDGARPAKKQRLS